MILNTIDAFEIIPNGLVKGLENVEIREHVDIIQTTAFWRSTRILRSVQ